MEIPRNVMFVFEASFFGAVLIVATVIITQFSTWPVPYHVGGP